MGIFKCEKCGHSWSDSATFTSCPICFGMGKRNEKCNCTHFAGPMGQKTNVIFKKNPNCPIHGGEVPLKNEETIKDSTVEIKAIKIRKYSEKIKVKKQKSSDSLLSGFMPGFKPGEYCPDCGGHCGNSNHNRRW